MANLSETELLLWLYLRSNRMLKICNEAIQEADAKIKRNEYGAQRVMASKNGAVPCADMAETPENRP